LKFAVVNSQFAFFSLLVSGSRVIAVCGNITFPAAGTALAQLPARAAALQSFFIRTVTDAFREDSFDFTVRARDHVHADEFADATGCRKLPHPWLL
jgi:hypothetical protein